MSLKKVVASLALVMLMLANIAAVSINASNALKADGSAMEFTYWDKWEGTVNTPGEFCTDDWDEGSFMIVCGQFFGTWLVGSGEDEECTYRGGVADHWFTCANIDP